MFIAKHVLPLLPDLDRSAIVAYYKGRAISRAVFLEHVLAVVAVVGAAFLGAVLLGARHPVGVMFAALLFGAFDGLTNVLPGHYPWIPPELIRMIPFAVTILALLLFSYRAQRALALRGVKA